MSEDIKEIIKQEYYKCADDPVYFLKKYGWIQHPQKGRMPFILFPFQEKVVKLFQKNQYSIVLKSRQLGISTLIAGYGLWLMTFHQDKNIVVICTKQETAKNLVTKVRFMHEQLPRWLKVKTVENNRLSLKLVNGSTIKAVSAAGDSGRSEASSLVVIDEAAFIDERLMEEIWGAIQPTLSTGGSCIILSTPNGSGNFFHRMWVKAESRDNGFIPIRLKWNLHPERTQAWRDEQDLILGSKLAAQECDTDFNTSGDTVIDNDIINWFEQTYVSDPMERRGLDNNLWIWEYPNYNHKYVVSADVARGDGKDYSAFHVIDIDTCTQVAEYKGQVGTTDFGNLLVGIASEYNDALLVVENSNMGWATIQTVLERGYKKFYYSPKDGSTIDTDMYLYNAYSTSIDNMTPGFTNSTKTRPLVFSSFDNYIKDKSIRINSKRTIEEMKVFIWHNGKPQAQVGYNDDLVVSLAIGLYIRNVASRYFDNGSSMGKTMLGAVTVVTPQGQNSVRDNNYNNSNPFIVQSNKGTQENISWLLG
jgi:hypothetical protein